MQKLAYLYGWRELLSDMDEVDDERSASSRCSSASCLGLAARLIPDGVHALGRDAAFQAADQAG